MSTYQIVAVGTFISYIYIVLMISYFSRPAGSRNDVNLIFLETWRNSAQSRAYVVENIIMMIPFGLLLPAFFKPSRNFFCCIPLGFMFSVCLEYSQFLSKRGYMQTDDVVMNVIGTSIGYVVFLLLDFIIRPLQKNARI
ncbi:VanZ family protein [Clostridium boliviensis]|uniref:VanZ family protein n=2 Tax=Clostridium boliviensis TaxID=318465 RepID=A0ABU4GQ38_9CLOT|nr:VanZ family protein [Clostridium boliviensis]